MFDQAMEIRPAQERRCDVRLENDAAALETVNSDRMQVKVRRFGARVSGIEIVFPSVRTAFLHVKRKEVEIHVVRVLALILPNAGSQFPYPLGAPEVRIHFPDLDLTERVPWLSGLFWFDPGPMAATIQNLPPLLQPLLGRLPKESFQFGIPCLWRNGEWNQDCDFFFVARQIHRMLTDPGAYSPTDAMNSEANFYWAEHKDALPLEPQIPELYCHGEDHLGEGSRRSEGIGGGFFLREVK
jgi:hypothetical protein